MSEQLTEEHLSTIEKFDAVEILKVFGQQSVCIVVIAFWAKDSQTGLREERGLCVKKVWNDVLNGNPNIMGMRLLWNSVFFVLPTNDISLATNFIKGVLSKETLSNIDSYCVIKNTEQNIEERIKLLDDMQSAVSNGNNFYTYNSFIKLLNGNVLST